jgi:hypothetical protein
MEDCMADHRLTPDGIQARQATRDDLAWLQLAEARVVQLRVPLLLETTRDRVFLAALDGTGNSIYKDAPAQHTVVGRLRNEIESLESPVISVGYVEGIGTQNGYLPNRIDGLLAVTFQARVEEAYYQFCLQAAKWIEEDPDVRVHLVGMGFSRGAEQVPALQRLVHERGIRDPGNAGITYDADGLLRSIRYADLPPLVAPERTVQAALIHDPVATSIRDQSRAFPSSNVSAFGLTALHESRGLFDATRHLPDGLSERGRVANFFVPGAHADVGGGYLIDGISRRVHNMNVDVLNTMFGEALLPKLPVPLDPRLYVIHRSEQHQLGLIGTNHYRSTGERRIHTELSAACRAPSVAACTRDPVDHELAATVQWRHVTRGRTPGGTDPKMDLALAAADRMHARDPSLLETVAARSSLPARAELLVARDHVEAMFDQFFDAARSNSAAGMRAVAMAYAETPTGRLMTSGYRLVQAWSINNDSPDHHRNLGLAGGTQPANEFGMREPGEQHPVPAMRTP